MAKIKGPIDRSQMSLYRDKKLVKPGIDDLPEDENKVFWWEADFDNVAAEVFNSIKFIETHQPGRINQLTSATRLYMNSSATGFLGGSFRSNYGNANTGGAGAGRISFNLCASLTDTLVAKMAKNKIVPSFITSGGIWGMQKQAEQLSKFVEGCFYANDVHSVGIEAFRDACVWGTGIIYVYNDHDEISIQKVYPHEIYVDEVEALSGKTRTMHRVQLIDRALVRERFRDNEEALQKIALASSSSSLDLGAVGATAADIITITESWHLPSGPDSGDGRYTICTNGDCLELKEYEKDYFPFAFFHYTKRLLGFWGQGVVERTQNLQMEINKLMILIQKSMWMGGGYKILMENGSKIVKQHLDNEVGTIITYSNTPPTYIAPPFLQAEIYPYVDALIAKGYQQEGVSQLAASSLKPQGVDSGAALRTYDNIADDRSLFTAQELEKFFMEIARLMIETAKDISKTKRGGYEVVYPGTMSFEKINWKDIKLKDSEYVMRAYPTSDLPDEPSGRLATIQEYMASGLISPRTGRKLLSMPDIEMNDKLANAPENLICKIIEDMLDTSEYRAPEPFYDLQLAKQLALEYYNYADLNNCPEEKLELLRRWMSQIDDLTGANLPPQPMQPEAAPMANPAPAPTSPMIQNTNNPVPTI